jgi:hypothetical protein
MSRAFRALTRAALSRRAGSSLSALVLLGLLRVTGGAGVGGFFEVGGGEGRGMKEGTRGLSGTSGRRCVGAGEGILGVFPRRCSTPMGV